MLLFIATIFSLQAQKFVSMENRWRMTLVNRGQTYAHFLQRLFRNWWQILLSGL